MRATADFGAGRGFAERRLELVQGFLLAAFAHRAQRLPTAVCFGPDRCYGDDLLMQSGGTSTVEREAAHEHDAGLRSRADDHGDPRKLGLEALT
jgi:hypothetical protein